MKQKGIYRQMRDADPASDRRMEPLEHGPAEAALAEDILAAPAGDPAPEVDAPRWSSGNRARRLALTGVAAAALAVIALVVSLGSGGDDAGAPSRAYGAELVRFAETTPLLLLEGPGWRVQDLYESETREGTEGSIEFVTGKAIPPETINGPMVELKRGGQVVGIASATPESVRQRKVELTWSHRSLGETIKFTHVDDHAQGRHWTKAPVLGTMALINTQATVYPTHNGRGRQMVGYWSEDGLLLELRASVPDLPAFEERLDWVTKVDAHTWLDAMPAKVVKAADHDATVRAMLRGIPLPHDFRPSLVPDAGLTTNRDQVAGAVTTTVSCLWFRQWGEARASSDHAAEAEAEQAMATYRRWPILRQERKESGEYPESIVKLVASMPSGVWQFGPHRYRLLPKAEGLGCARLGIPVLPWKQKRQGERGGSPLPR
jgi:hypothetical protein